MSYGETSMKIADWKIPGQDEPPDLNSRAMKILKLQQESNQTKGIPRTSSKFSTEFQSLIPNKSSSSDSLE